jgi:hypothetical protein
VCIHSPPALIVWRPVTIEKLSLIWKRQISSSTFGAGRTGCRSGRRARIPSPVSAGCSTASPCAAAFSREYVKWNSFSRFALSVVNRFSVQTLIFDGPSVPLADVP